MTHDDAELDGGNSAAERLAGEVRRLRREADLTQAGLAHLIGYSEQYVCMAERPRKGLPSANLVQAIDNALGAGGDLVALRDRAEADRQARRKTHSPAKPPTRRDATTLLGLAYAAASQPALDAVDHLASGLGHCPRRVDHKLVEGHRDIAHAFATLYRSADARAVLPIAEAYADDLLTLLDAAMDEAIRTELGGIAAGVHAQIGLWACHLHRPAVAYRHLATARQVADELSDRAVQARTLGAFSYLFSTAPRGGHGGNARRCVAMLTKALALAARSDEFTVGWLATWRADQHATLGDLDAAQRDLELADHKLNDSGNDSPAAGFFARSVYGYGMRDHWDSVRAVALALAGHFDEADHTFNQVQAGAANARRRIATFGHQALVQVRAREPEMACATLRQAVRLAIDNHYTMGVQRAMGVRAGFDPDWPTLRCVRALDEQLRPLWN